MSAPANDYFFDVDIAREAGQLWRENTGEREENEKQADNKNFEGAETKERLAKRANRLIAKAREAAAGDRGSMPEGLRELIDREPLTPDEVNNALLERVIDETRDFLSVSFFGRGMQAMRCAARMVTSLGSGRVGYGTGFLVSPRLLLTNFHVLPDAASAINTIVEFDYQLDIEGNPLKVQRFELDPSMFFYNDKELDFTVVAVNDRSASGGLIGGYGWAPLFKEQGKVSIGNCVNIVQHPKGEMKQVVIRENKLVQLLPNFLHYKGDTEPGSSGSPVFNDEWEIVGLHHSGVPMVDDKGNMLDVNGKKWVRGDDPLLIHWIANEGVRVSQIVAHLETAKMEDHETRLLDQLLAAGEIPQPPAAPLTPENIGSKPARTPSTEDSVKPVTESRSATLNIGGGVTVTIPLNITVSLGTSTGATSVRDDSGDSNTIAVQPPSEMLLESVKPDPNYEDRPGYDPDFLGFAAPLPKLVAAIRDDAVEIEGAKKGAELELKYHHYSVIMNRKRRIAFVAAVNFNAKAKVKYARAVKDKWFFDPRIDEEFQAGEEFYAANPLDRGHLVRRADGGWGSTEKSAKTANDDTFHFTNCSPQHEVYNQSSKASSKGLLLWGNLENHVAKQGKAAVDGKLAVFNGPVLRKTDRLHRGLRVPKEFWKIIVYERDSGKPGAAAFILSQAQLIKNLPEEEFEAEEYRPFQVRVSVIEAKTKLDFGKFRKWDSLPDDADESLFEGGTEAVPLESLGDVIL